MSTVTFSSDLTANLIRHMASDEYAIEAARASVSVLELEKITGEKHPVEKEIDPGRFIDKLVKLRHGVPFEHCTFTFGVKVPIFIARQWVKHRLTSMNEMSGRYGKVLPEFYVPGEERPLVNEGSKMEPKMVMGSYMQYQTTDGAYRKIAQAAWDEYEFMLKMGITEEVARGVLPLATFTQFYWTLNARSVMGFLERRVDSEAARVPTHPQWEIQVAAELLEEQFKAVMPYTHAAFVKYGRVNP